MVPGISVPVVITPTEPVSPPSRSASTVKRRSRSDKKVVTKAAISTHHQDHSFASLSTATSGQRHGQAQSLRHHVVTPTITSSSKKSSSFSDNRMKTTQETSTKKSTRDKSSSSVVGKPMKAATPSPNVPSSLLRSTFSSGRKVGVTAVR